VRVNASANKACVQRKDVHLENGQLGTRIVVDVSPTTTAKIHFFVLRGKGLSNLTLVIVIANQYLIGNLKKDSVGQERLGPKATVAALTLKPNAEEEGNGTVIETGV